VIHVRKIEWAISRLGNGLLSDLAVRALVEEFYTGEVGRSSGLGDISLQGYVIETAEGQASGIIPVRVEQVGAMVL